MRPCIAHLSTIVAVCYVDVNLFISVKQSYQFLKNMINNFREAYFERASSFFAIAATASTLEVGRSLA